MDRSGNRDRSHIRNYPRERRYAGGQFSCAPLNLSSTGVTPNLHGFNPKHSATKGKHFGSNKNAPSTASRPVNTGTQGRSSTDISTVEIIIGNNEDETSGPSTSPTGPGVYITSVSPHHKTVRSAVQSRRDHSKQLDSSRAKTTRPEDRKKEELKPMASTGNRQSVQQKTVQPRREQSNQSDASQAKTIRAEDHQKKVEKPTVIGTGNRQSVQQKADFGKQHAATVISVRLETETGGNIPGFDRHKSSKMSTERLSAPPANKVVGRQDDIPGFRQNPIRPAQTTQQIQKSSVLGPKNWCPIPGCICKASFKQHVMDKHIPSVFYDFTDPKVTTDSALSQKRITGLRHLADYLLGTGSSAVQLVAFLNERVSQMFSLSTTAIFAMNVLCEYTGWNIPSEFTTKPVNHPAVLIHWGPMVHLLSFLNVSDRQKFYSEFHDPALAENRISFFKEQVAHKDLDKVQNIGETEKNKETRFRSEERDRRHREADMEVKARAKQDERDGRHKDAERDQRHKSSDRDARCRDLNRDQRRRETDLARYDVNKKPRDTDRGRAQDRERAGKRRGDSSGRSKGQGSEVKVPRLSHGDMRERDGRHNPQLDGRHAPVEEQHFHGRESVSPQLEHVRPDARPARYMRQSLERSQGRFVEDFSNEFNPADRPIDFQRNPNREGFYSEDRPMRRASDRTFDEEEELQMQEARRILDKLQKNEYEHWETASDTEMFDHRPLPPQNVGRVQERKQIDFQEYEDWETDSENEEGPFWRTPDRDFDPDSMTASKPWGYPIRMQGPVNEDFIEDFDHGGNNVRKPSGREMFDSEGMPGLPVQNIRRMQDRRRDLYDDVDDMDIDSDQEGMQMQNFDAADTVSIDSRNMMHHQFGPSGMTAHHFNPGSSMSKHLSLVETASPSVSLGGMASQQGGLNPEILSQHGSQFDPIEMGTQQFDPIGMGAQQFDPVGMGPQQFGPVGFCPQQIDQLEMSSQQLDPARIGPRQFNPVGMGPQQMGSIGTASQQFNPMGMVPQQMEPVELPQQQFGPAGMRQQQFGLGQQTLQPNTSTSGDIQNMAFDQVSLPDTSQPPPGEFGVMKQPSQPFTQQSANKPDNKIVDYNHGHKRMASEDLLDIERHQLLEQKTRDLEVEELKQKVITYEMKQKLMPIAGMLDDLLSKYNDKVESGKRHDSFDNKQRKTGDSERGKGNSEWGKRDNEVSRRDNARDEGQSKSQGDGKKSHGDSGRSDSEKLDKSSEKSKDELIKKLQSELEKERKKNQGRPVDDGKKQSSDSRSQASKGRPYQREQPRGASSHRDRIKTLYNELDRERMNKRDDGTVNRRQSGSSDFNDLPVEANRDRSDYRHQARRIGAGRGRGRSLHSELDKERMSARDQSGDDGPSGSRDYPTDPHRDRSDWRQPARGAGVQRGGRPFDRGMRRGQHSPGGGYGRNFAQRPGPSEEEYLSENKSEHMPRTVPPNEARLDKAPHIIDRSKDGQRTGQTEIKSLMDLETFPVNLHQNKEKEPASKQAGPGRPSPALGWQTGRQSRDEVWYGDRLDLFEETQQKQVNKPAPSLGTRGQFARPNTGVAENSHFRDRVVDKDRFPSRAVKIKERNEERGRLERDHNPFMGRVPAAGRSQEEKKELPLQGFDSYFTFDKLVRRIKAETMKTGRMEVEDTFKINEKHKPELEVELMGGLMVFNDPSLFKDIEFPLNPKWKVAVGIDPARVHTATPDRLALFQSLAFNPLVSAIGGTGLDYTQKKQFFNEQEETLMRVAGLASANRPLILHIRERKKLQHEICLPDFPAHRRCLEIVKKKCDPNQKIMIHCFSGDTITLTAFSMAFPNCMFSFGGNVDHFDVIQNTALRSVPLGKLLIETMAPYGLKNADNAINTPAFIGVVAKKVAVKKMIPVEVILKETLKNAENFFGPPKLKRTESEFKT